MESLLKASKKQLLQQLGTDPEASNISSWLSQEVPRDDVQQWFIRNYKKDPSIWNSQNKEAVAHYIGMSKTSPDSELGKLRFDKSHSFEDGLNLWKQAEQKVQSEAKDKRLIEPDSGTEKKIDLGDGWGWHKLDRASCTEEGNAMGHCGNTGSPSEGDHIWSLRKEKKIGGKTYHEPHLTFIENNGYIGESKGRNNEKPHKKYHEAITELLKHPEIKENIGGGYAPNNNFYINDLDPEMREKLLREKPSIERLFTQRAGKIDPNQYPKKHQEEVRQHNAGIDQINSGQYRSEATLFRDIDPKKAKEAISSEINDEDNEEGVDDGLIIMRSPHLDASHIDEALDKGHRYSSNFLSSHAANASHIDKALNSNNPNIRYAAAASPHFGPQHMDKALNDEDPNIREAAQERQVEFKQKGLIKKLEDLNTLFKALGKLSNISPSIRIPSMAAPVAPKAPSLAPSSKKNPVKQAQQLSNPDAKTFAMKQAKGQVASTRNSLAFKSEDDGQLYYAFEGERRLNNEPMSAASIYEKWGNDIKLTPIKVEKLETTPNGQWKLTEE